MKIKLLSLLMIAAAVSGCGGGSDQSSAPYYSASSSGGATQNVSGMPFTPQSGSSSSSGAIGVIEPFEPVDPQNPQVAAEATFFYFSYDESASTAARDLVFSALNLDSPIRPSWGRSFEFLNAETFKHNNPNEFGPFKLSWSLKRAAPDEIPLAIDFEGELYALGVNVTGPTLSKQDRNNVVLTLLVDISGSMNSPYADLALEGINSRLDLVKYSLNGLTKSLKAGDVLNLVTFESRAETVLQGWQYEKTNPEWRSAVDDLRTVGSTNLDAGIRLAYDVAQATFDGEKSNRVIILTDANANRGQVDPSIIADNTIINGLEGIHFAGIGIGDGFNDTFLNELTDLGKSVYSAMMSPSDADNIFGEGFMRFVDSAVKNVRFKLTYPQDLDQLKSASENISTEKEKVSTTNFAYNSDQFFLEFFSAEGEVDSSETMILEVEYENSEGELVTQNTEMSIEDLLSEPDSQIISAAFVTTLADLVANKVSCDIVMASSLYGLSIQDATGLKYQNAISDFCMRSTQPDLWSSK